MNVVTSYHKIGSLADKIDMDWINAIFYLKCKWYFIFGYKQKSIGILTQIVSNNIGVVFMKMFQESILL